MINNNTKIKFKNGSSIESITTDESAVKSKVKIFKTTIDSTSIKYLLGDLFDGLKWYQKIYLKLLFTLSGVRDKNLYNFRK